MELYVERGFEQTTVAEIAERAGLTARTFFRYFPSKESVLLAEVESRCAELITLLEAQPAAVPPLEAIRSAMLTVVAPLQGDRTHLVRRDRLIAATPSLHAHKLTDKEAWRDAIFDVLVAREADSKRPSSRLQLHLVTATALAAVEAALATWLDEDGDLVEIVNRSFDAVAAGLR